MADNPPTFDAAAAWTDAMALLNGQREILLTIAGFFLFLPTLLLNALRPFSPTGASGTLVEEFMRWTNMNLHWVALVALLAALGRLAMLILLLWPGRPTVGEALSAGGRMLLPFVVMDLLIGLTLVGGLFLFLLPALYIFGRTFLAEPGFVARRARGPITGITAGLDTSRRNGWRIALVATIIYLAGAILAAALGSVVGVLGAIAGGGSTAAFLNGLVDAGVGAGVALVMLLMSVAAWRQLARAAVSPA